MNDEVFEEAELAGPVSADDISKAEIELGVVFPDQYRFFLSHYGSALFNGVEIYGLFNSSEEGQVLWQNVVDVTQELRGLGQEGTENKSYIPISENGFGDYYFLDTSVSPEVKIVALGAGGAKEEFYDLYVFINKMIEIV
ncbi:MAG: SMI1/KNR4 family protein [Amphritea sp.]|nr:SMI1/KNR4 family protein [Amphritea sp.]